MHSYIHGGKELSSHKGESLLWDDFVLVLLQYFPGHISCWWLSSKWDRKVHTDGGCAVGADGFSVSYLGSFWVHLEECVAGSFSWQCSSLTGLVCRATLQVSRGHVGGRPGEESRWSAALPSTTWCATLRWITRFLLILLKLFDSTEIFLNWLFLTNTPTEGKYNEVPEVFIRNEFWMPDNFLLFRS